jgi:ribonuclease HI
LGAFRTSPVESLYVAANEASLENRRIKLSLQYVVKLAAANPSNPAHDCVFRPNYRQLHTAKQKNIKPLGIRMQPHLAASQIDLRNIADTEISETPPWEIHQPQVFLHLTKHKKSDTDASVFRNDFLEFKAGYPNYTCIYTDGSKDNDRVASADIYNRKAVGVRLAGSASIYTAEIQAILLALQEIEMSNKKNFIIFSDSLSTLQALDNCNTNHPLLMEVLSKLTQLHLYQFDIVFCWVPSHVGLSGNEKADSAAKQALNFPLRPYLIPHTDFRQDIFSYTKHIWQESWSTQTSNKLHSIQPDVGFWQPYRDLPRRDQVVLTRCRIGHSRLTHSWLLNAEPLPKCIPCDCPMSIHHLIVECEDYAHVRRQYLKAATLKDICNNEYNNVLAFLKTAGLYQHF